MTDKSDNEASVDPLDTTQELALIVPERAPFSQWTHGSPILVEVLAEHEGIPAQQVVDRLRSLFEESADDPRVPPLDRQAEAVRRYLKEHVG